MVIRVRHKVFKLNAFVHDSPFRLLLICLVLTILVEIGFTVGSGILTKHFVAENRQILAAVAEQCPKRWDDSRDMLPPAIGHLYAMQSLAVYSPPTPILQKMASQGSDTCQDYVAKLSLRQYRAALAASYVCGLNCRDLEIQLLEHHWPRGDLVVSNYLRRLRETAESSLRYGYIVHSATAYERFLALGRKSWVTNDDLTWAEVRSKSLTGSSFVSYKAWISLLDGPLSDLTVYLQDADPGIRSLAIFTTASKEYRAHDIPGALTFLQNHASDFGPLRDECEFLTAKLHGYEGLNAQTDEAQRRSLDMAGAEFEALANRLPKDHYLLDDIFYVWSTNRN